MKVALRPQSFDVLLARALAELDAQRAIFEFPRRMFWTAPEDLDLSVALPGGRAATPLGPAAGPHTQLAQNLVVSWLAGARVLELKTVQVRDRLEIPRPCIDAADVGYNVEWSQELPIGVSAEQYAAAWLLVHALAARGIGGSPPLFDVSVGYDLDGVRSDRVARFLDAMTDAGPLLERLRRTLPPGLRAAADVAAPTRIAYGVTLSTFHGCPPDEIERIAEHLLARHGMHVVVKLNPTLLGYDEVESLVRAELGYDEVRLDRAAFHGDLQWAEAIAMFARLEGAAARAGLTLGAKFTNTLIVKNTRDVLEGDVTYLSGAPLHPLAVRLAARFARATGGRFPLSFSAGVDDGNVADVVGCGFAPVTSVTDLLKPNGYRRLPLQVRALAASMREAGVKTVPELIAHRAGAAPDAAPPRPAELQVAMLANLEDYSARVADDPRYHATRHRARPARTGPLAAFDCASCNKCLLVCPNGAFFELPFTAEAIDTWDLVLERGEIRRVPARFQIARERQWVLFADFCNACGNCDPFCPESGGPYRVKPRFHGSHASFEDAAPEDGLWVDRTLGKVHARFGGTLHLLEPHEAGTRFSDGTIEAVLGEDHAPLHVRALRESRQHVLPLARYHALRLLRDAALKTVNPVTAPGLLRAPAAGTRRAGAAGGR